MYMYLLEVTKQQTCMNPNEHLMPFDRYLTAILWDVTK